MGRTDVCYGSFRNIRSLAVLLVYVLAEVEVVLRVNASLLISVDFSSCWKFFLPKNAII